MRAASLSASALAAIVTAAACGGNVVVDHDAAAGGAGGAGVTVTGTSTATSTGVGGAGGGCGRTYEYFDFRLETWDGIGVSCGLSMPGGSQVFHLQGQVIESGGDYLAIDSCPPNADCAPMVSYLFVSSPGLVLQTPPGVFVDLTIQIDYPMGCAQTLLVRNLPEWGGVFNMEWPAPTLWLAGSEGATTTLEGSPFWIETVPLGCYTNPEPTPCGAPEDYALRLRQAFNPDDPGITLTMGESTWWQVSDEGQYAEWQVRNLKSFETGECDDYWNWGYYVAFTWPLD